MIYGDFMTNNFIDAFYNLTHLGNILVTEAKKEEKDTVDPEQLELGKEIESEHKDIWELLKDFSDNVVKERLPFGEKEMYEKIARAHLKEIPDYYTRLKKMEDEAKAVSKKD